MPVRIRLGVPKRKPYQEPSIMKPNPRKKQPTLAERNLDARQKDFHTMMNDPLGNAAKAPHGAFHKPGSLQKK